MIVGGGVGGLAAAIRLRVAGHRVALLERNEELGGKLTVRRRDGFTFETGPSLLTLPHVFDDLLRAAGTSLAEQVDLVRLDPQCHYRFADGTALTTHDDRAATIAAFDRLAPGAGRQVAGLLDHGDRIWDVSWRTFFAGPMDSPVQLARRMRSPADLTAIDPLRTLHRLAARTFPGEPRLQQWLGRYATYSGSSPYRAPATLACIPAIESRFGCWYVRGGLGALRDALVRVAGQVGVDTETGVEVTALDDDGTAVRGVRTATGRRVPADLVVADVDAGHLYQDLLPDRRAARRLARAPRSLSGFVLLIGVEGRTPGLAHHTIAFSPDASREFTQLAAGLPADDPTVYVCCSAVTDPTQAPAGAENWFVLVNMPPGTERWTAQATAAERDRILAVLAARGLDVRGRARFVETITPADIGSRFRSAGGAIYGTSSDGRRAAFLRPGNRGPRRGLYLVGGSSHPGGGLPLVAHSAAIVDRMVREDGW